MSKRTAPVPFSHLAYYDYRTVPSPLPSSPNSVSLVSPTCPRTLPSLSSLSTFPDLRCSSRPSLQKSPEEVNDVSVSPLTSACSSSATSDSKHRQLRRTSARPKSPTGIPMGPSNRPSQVCHDSMNCHGLSDTSRSSILPLSMSRTSQSSRSLGSFSTGSLPHHGEVNIVHGDVERAAEDCAHTLLDSTSTCERTGFLESAAAWSQSPVFLQFSRAVEQIVRHRAASKVEASVAATNRRCRDGRTFACDRRVPCDNAFSQTCFGEGPRLRESSTMSKGLISRTSSSLRHRQCGSGEQGVNISVTGSCHTVSLTQDGFSTSSPTQPVFCSVTTFFDLSSYKVPATVMHSRKPVFTASLPKTTKDTASDGSSPTRKQGLPEAFGATGLFGKSSGPSPSSSVGGSLLLGYMFYCRLYERLMNDAFHVQGTSFFAPIILQ
eukprot:GHVQ01004603.1.p2 GENE.GHVQ01004603.1~~GHVQ01004603.1.p2  ORF type:complete len:436 (+),score=45.91 GHVQ01004603.1:577-1884(+)